tara:strand:+ start:282 stop:467 length:186 start_codon:yes stop_codon:yes gene_type:complete
VGRFTLMGMPMRVRLQAIVLVKMDVAALSIKSNQRTDSQENHHAAHHALGNLTPSLGHRLA